MQLPAKEDELKRFLAALPLDKAATLAAAVERARLSGPTAMPVDVILAALRPVLRRARKRMPTPRRLFCVAFEDLLIDGPREEKQTGRILRASVAKLWQWLASVGFGKKLADLEARIAAAILAQESIAQSEMVAQLRAAAAGAVRLSFGQAAKSEPVRRALAQNFGGADGLADVEEIALVLEASHELDAIRAKLPRAIDALTGDHLAAIGDIHDDLGERRPELCPYIAPIVLGRLVRPWEVLRLAGVVSRRRDETLFSAGDMGAVGDLLLADMQQLADELCAVPPDKMNPAMVLPKLERFVTMANGLIREIGVRREGEWGQRLVKLRHLASDAIDASIARAPAQIIAALPLQKFGAFAGHAPRRPDLAREPDAARVARALSWAKLLSGSATFAADGAFHSAHREALDRVNLHLRRYGEAMAGELRTIDEAHRARAQAFLAAAEILGDAILGREETDLLRRRVAAATATASRA